MSTVAEPAHRDTAPATTGRVVRVIGPVVDVEFPRGQVPDLLNALHESRETKTEMTDMYKLDADMDASSLKKADRLTTNSEKRLYLTSCWLETLCTAEARFLGYVYQELYGRPYSG